MREFVNNDAGKEQERKEMNGYCLVASYPHKNGRKRTGDKTGKEKKDEQFNNKKKKVHHFHNYIEHTVC